VLVSLTKPTFALVLSLYLYDIRMQICCTDETKKASNITKHILSRFFSRKEVIRYTICIAK